MDPYVEPHLNWRFLGPGDDTEVDAFRQQLDALDNSVLSGVIAAITDSDALVGEGMAIGGWDAYRSLSAIGVSYIADTEPLRFYLIGGVHPVHRHQSIGAALFHWQVDRAVEWREQHRPGRPLWMGCYSELSRPGTERVATRFGFTAERYYYDLQRDLTAPVPVHEVDGVRFEPLTDERAEEVRLLHNHCFAPLGGVDVDPSQWRARLEEESFRRDWSYLALDGDRVVGYAMSGEEEGGDAAHPGGWTERFGVHPDYRGRGVSLALVGHCLRAMRGSGCREAGIGIDTLDGVGIKRFASALGYATRDAVALLSRVVP